MNRTKVRCKNCEWVTDPKGYKRTRFSLCQKGCGERGIRKVTTERKCDEYTERGTIAWEAVGMGISEVAE